MKDEFNKNFNENDASAGSDSPLETEREIGVAINESAETESSGDTDPFLDDEEEMFADTDEEVLLDKQDEQEVKKQKKSPLAFAQSSKEQLMEKLRGNLVYILIALILIIPGAFKLYGFIASEDNTSMSEVEEVDFVETTPPAVSVMPVESEEPSENQSLESLMALERKEATPVNDTEEPSAVSDVPQTTQEDDSALTENENDTRSEEEGTPIDGSGSDSASASISQDETVAETSTSDEVKAEQAQPEALTETDASEEIKVQPPVAEPVVTTAPASVSAEPSRASDQILERYFEQETKVEQQMTQLLSRMDEMNARLAVLENIDQRLTALEENDKKAVSVEQVQELTHRVAQLEQSVGQLKQVQQSAVATAPAVVLPNAQNTAAATGITVEAVIPGRAWIRNQDGVLMVLEVGDEIPGIGKVTRIDAREGLVATTTQVFKQ